MDRKLKNICSDIKLVLTDVDGVLTDGGMYYSKNGDTLKKFHTRDGMGVTLLRKSGIPTIFLKKEKNSIIRQWSKKMNIKKLYDGIIKKEKILDDICRMNGINPNQVAYIGDDINDIELLKKVGLSATPHDGIIEAQKICKYVCKTNGGSGSFRELADLILSYQDKS